MIYTSSYDNWKSNMFIPCSISGDRGKSVNYKGKYYSKLAPKRSFWDVWEANRKAGILSEKENNYYYIEQFYLEVLSKLDPEEVLRELDDHVLLCFEEPDQFCHRHIVAAWLKILLGINVPEIAGYGSSISSIPNTPKYIKNILEDVMRKHTDMKGYNSLRAVYLSNKVEKLKEKIYKIEFFMGRDANDLRQEVEDITREIDEVENEYNEKHKVLAL